MGYTRLYCPPLTTRGEHSRVLRATTTPLITTRTSRPGGGQGAAPSRARTTNSAPATPTPPAATWNCGAARRHSPPLGGPHPSADAAHRQSPAACNDDPDEVRGPSGSCASRSPTPRSSADTGRTSRRVTRANCSAMDRRHLRPRPTAASTSPATSHHLGGPRRRLSHRVRGCLRARRDLGEPGAGPDAVDLPGVPERTSPLGAAFSSSSVITSSGPTAPRRGSTTSSSRTASATPCCMASTPSSPFPCRRILAIIRSARTRAAGGNRTRMPTPATTPTAGTPSAAPSPTPAAPAAAPAPSETPPATAPTCRKRCSPVGGPCTATNSIELYPAGTTADEKPPTTRPAAQPVRRPPPAR